VQFTDVETLSFCLGEKVFFEGSVVKRADRICYLYFILSLSVNYNLFSLGIIDDFSTLFDYFAASLESFFFASFFYCVLLLSLCFENYFPKDCEFESACSIDYLKKFEVSYS
jgi:hypothetical protein